MASQLSHAVARSISSLSGAGGLRSFCARFCEVFLPSITNFLTYDVFLDFLHAFGHFWFAGLEWEVLNDQEFECVSVSWF